MNCQKCKIEIERRDLRRENLSGAAEAHLADCAACRIFGEERLALRRLIGGLEKISAPADFDFRMRARMAAERSVRAPRLSQFNFSPASFSWPLAGCLALVISASLYFQQKRSDVAMPAGAAITVSPAPPAFVDEATHKSIQESNQTKNSKIQRSGDEPSIRRSLAPRRGVLPERIAVRADVGRAQTLETVSGGGSNTSSVMGSPVRYAATGTTKGESTVIPVQLIMPERPLRILLRDANGVARTISIDPISFGSRDVIRHPATFTKSSLSSNQGVW